MDNTTPGLDFPRLLPVTPGDVGGRLEMLVDSRQLHATLGVGAQHRHWIARRLEQHPCVEGADYLKLDRSNLTDQVSEHGGDRRSATYALTLRLAKLIAMSEHTPAGDRVRDYFLECEQRALAVQTDDSDEALLARCDDSEFLLKIVTRKILAIQAAKKQIAALETKVAEDAPKVEFHAAVTGSVNSRSLMATAHVLKIGRTTLVRKLREMGHVQQDEVLPYRQYEIQGLYEVEQRYRLDRKTGEHVRYEIMLVTAKGLEYLQKHLAREKRAA